LGTAEVEQSADPKLYPRLYTFGDIMSSGWLFDQIEYPHSKAGNAFQKGQQLSLFKTCPDWLTAAMQWAFFYPVTLSFKIGFLISQPISH
jgi:hypothetical protein